jgi:hypothetical protein
MDEPVRQPHGSGGAGWEDLESLLEARPFGDRAGPPRYVGRSRLLRVLPPVLLGAGLATSASGRLPAGVALVVVAAVALRTLPWRFAVVDQGIALWFGSGRRRFLWKEEVTVRVDLGGAIARRRSERFGYPLTDGVLERRRSVLRAVLVEHGFHVVS